MDSNVDFFQRKFSNPQSFSRRKKYSHVWIWILLIIVLLAIWWLVYWKMFLAPANLNDYEQENNHVVDFSLQEQVYLQWEIKANGDITTHTHTINDANYWIIRIKSDSINLFDYVWFVELTGVVEKFYQWNPIVKVTALSWTISKTEEETHVVVDDNPWVYILWAWIQFLPSFFDEYVLLNEWENGEIRIQNIETEEEIVLNYFRCNPSDPNRNCKGLSEVFENNQAQSFITSEQDKYYKLSETQSWFVANWDRWGIFINDVSDDEVFKLKDLIKFANEKNINEWIKARASSICQWSWERLQSIQNSEINLKQEWLVVTVSGNGNEKQITCQILVDFSLPEKWKLINLKIWDDVVISEEVENSETEDVAVSVQEYTWSNAQVVNNVFDKDVPQFPIKEDWLVYPSNRWGYDLQFPSQNISYAVSSVKENFGREDVVCSYVINVIKYSDRENLEISPAIRIYECIWTVSEPWSPEILVYSVADKKFVVQMNDGSWYDFSKNLKFQERAESN